MRNRQKNQTITIVVFIALIALLMVAVNVFGKMSSTDTGADKPHPMPPPPSPALLEKQWPAILQHAAAPPRGPANAPFTLVEFGDFQCPQCAKMRPLIETFVNASHGKANFCFVHRPFPQEHKWAITAAAASEVASDFHKFWPMYDLLYTHRDDLEPGYYGEYASQIGISKAAFDAAYRQPKYQERVIATSAFSDSLQVFVTPTLVVRDNVAGKVTSYRGKEEIDKLIANPPWGAPKQGPGL